MELPLPAGQRLPEHRTVVLLHLADQERRRRNGCEHARQARIPAAEIVAADALEVVFMMPPLSVLCSARRSRAPGQVFDPASLLLRHQASEGIGLPLAFRFGLFGDLQRRVPLPLERAGKVVAGFDVEVALPGTVGGAGEPHDSPGPLVVRLCKVCGDLLQHGQRQREVAPVDRPDDESGRGRIDRLPRDAPVLLHSVLRIVIRTDKVSPGHALPKWAGRGCTWPSSAGR